MGVEQKEKEVHGGPKEKMNRKADKKVICWTSYKIEKNKKIIISPDESEKWLLWVWPLWNYSVVERRYSVDNNSRQNRCSKKLD